jgi:hypothetical protein
MSSIYQYKHGIIAGLFFCIGNISMQKCVLNYLNYYKKHSVSYLRNVVQYGYTSICSIIVVKTSMFLLYYIPYIHQPSGYCNF